MAENQKNIDASVRASRLHALTHHSEWGEMQKILMDIYTTNLAVLIEKEHSEARGAVKCIDLIWSKLYDNIRFGEKIRVEMLDKYKNQIKGESVI
jgi:hypothetical protein